MIGLGGLARAVIDGLLAQRKTEWRNLAVLAEQLAEVLNPPES
jgi:hypothetical protein